MTLWSGGISAAHFGACIVCVNIHLMRERTPGTPAAQTRTQDQAIGRSRGGLSTKIIWQCAGWDVRSAFVLTAGQKGDVPQGAALMEGSPAEFVIADADYIREAAAMIGAQAVIPNNPSRAIKHPLGKHLSKQRHLVECCFSKLKPFRPIATRYKGPHETTLPS
jgi:transposase